MKKILIIICMLFLLTGCKTKEIEDYFYGMNSEYTVNDIKSHYGEPDKEHEEKFPDGTKEYVIEYNCEIEEINGNLGFTFLNNKLSIVAWFPDTKKEKGKEKILKNYLEKKFGKRYKTEESELFNNFTWKTEDGTLELTEYIKEDEKYNYYIFYEFEE